jgi:hypothetical protein
MSLRRQRNHGQVYEPHRIYHGGELLTEVARTTTKRLLDSRSANPNSHAGAVVVHQLGVTATGSTAGSGWRQVSRPMLLQRG